MAGALYPNRHKWGAARPWTDVVTGRRFTMRICDHCGVNDSRQNMQDGCPGPDFEDAA